MADYCQGFRAHMNEDDVIASDLVHSIDYHELIFGLPRSTRLLLASPVFQHLHPHRANAFDNNMSLSSNNMSLSSSRSAGPADRLLEEVRNGDCNVGLVGNEVVRTV